MALVLKITVKLTCKSGMLSSSSVKFFFFEYGDSDFCPAAFAFALPAVGEELPPDALSLALLPLLVKCGNRKLNFRFGLCVLDDWSHTKSFIDLQIEAIRRVSINKRIFRK